MHGFTEARQASDGGSSRDIGRTSRRFGKGSLAGARLLGPPESGSGVLNRDHDALGLHVDLVKAPPTPKGRGV